jgi:hypothetical protein
MGDQKPIDGQLEVRLVEVEKTIKDSKAVWGRKSVSLVRSAEGTPQWIIALIEDITERKQVEEGLFRAMGASEALNRELEQRVRNRTAEIESQYKEPDELNLIVRDYALDDKTVYRRLKEGGIDAGDDDRIKELADKHDSTPPP